MIPVDAEPLGQPEVYGEDRLFAYVRLDLGTGSRTRTPRSHALAGCRPPGRAHRPVPERLDLGGAVLRVGVRDGGRGRAAGSQPVRPARRRGLQGEDARAHRASTSRRASSPTGGADPGGGRSVRVRGRAQRRRARRSQLARCAPGRPPRPRATRETTSPCCPTSSARRSTSRRCARFAPWCATAPVRRPASGSGRGSCTPPGRPTRAVPTPACSCRSPATTSSTSRFRATATRSASSRRRRRAATSPCLRERGRRALRLHIGLDVEAGLRSLGGAVTRALSA